MTVSLALDLSVERISLLQRQDGRWYRVAQASCDPDLISEEMHRLRNQADSRAATGDGPVPVLLVLPEEQGVFLSCDVANDPPTPRQLAAENGLIPDRVRLDWRVAGDRLQVAALELETLEQAEGFVAAYGFASAGTLLAPSRAAFSGTPWMGWADAERHPGEAYVQGTDVVSLQRREILAHPPESLRPEPTDARATLAAQIDPAHLVPLEDDPNAQDTGKVRRSFWLTQLRVRKLWSGARLPRVLGRGLVWSVVLLAGLAGLSLLPDALKTTENEPAVVARSETTVAKAPQTAVAPVKTGGENARISAQAPVVTDFDRASAFSASPVMRVSPQKTEISDFDLPGLDSDVISDALALAWPVLPGENTPDALPVPPPADQTFALDERGFVRPSADGQRTPEGYLVVTGAPPRTPVVRPDPDERPVILVAIDPSTLAEDDPFWNLRPPVRPTNLVERFERARFGGRTEKELLAFRPKARPLSAQDLAPVAAPPTRLAISTGPRPPVRPKDLNSRFAAASTAQKKSAAQSEKSSSRQVAAASTAAVDTTPVSRASTAAPTAPSRGSVAERATQKKQLDLSEVNLLGTFGASSRPRALVRMPGGRVVNVSVGDRVDGGKVQNIGKGQMVYVKGGRTVTLRMPSG